MQPEPSSLTRREREIMEIVYRRGEATAAEVQTALSGEPSYSTVRALLRILEEKGALKHRVLGLRYVFAPVVARTRARKSALRKLVETFFSGSPVDAVAALLEDREARLQPEDFQRLQHLLNEAQTRRAAPPPSPPET